MTPPPPNAELSDEELRKLLKPIPTNDEALKIVRNAINSHAEDDMIEIVRPLDSYDDCNFQISINGVSFLLKIHNGVESADFMHHCKDTSDYFAPGQAKSVIHLQNAMLWTLDRAGIPTSAPSAQHDPVSIQKVAVADPSRSPADLAVRLLSWIPGSPMSDRKLLALEHFGSVGRMLGKIHTTFDSTFAVRPEGHLVRAESDLVERQQQETTAAVSVNNHDTTILNHIRDSSLKIPAQRFHQWDQKHTKDLRSFLKFIRDDKRRSILESIITEFDERILQGGVGDRFRKGLNHGDFNGM